MPFKCEHPSITPYDVPAAVNHGRQVGWRRRVIGNVSPENDRAAFSREHHGDGYERGDGTRDQDIAHEGSVAPGGRQWNGH